MLKELAPTLVLFLLSSGLSLIPILHKDKCHHKLRKVNITLLVITLLMILHKFIGYSVIAVLVSAHNSISLRSHILGAFALAFIPICIVGYMLYENSRTNKKCD